MYFIYRLFQCFFTWRIKLPTLSSEAQAICACAFGKGDERCNIAIASHVTDKASQYDLPYCVQQEVGRYVSTGLSGYCSVESADTHCKKYVGTYETVREQVEKYLRPRRITAIHIEAQQHHAWRVVMCYQKFGIEVVSVCTEDKPYPSKSTQRWCRSKLRFIPYEILARLLYLTKGYI